jgi:hypothetical protein
VGIGKNWNCGKDWHSAGHWHKILAVKVATLISAFFLVAFAISAMAQENQPTTREVGQWSFSNYPAAAHFSGKPAQPLLVTPRERNFRTAIQTQASSGPNFAGHFTLAHWGCGSPCLSFVIIDAASGAIYDFKESVGCADKNGMDASIDFKLDSRLVIATGFSEKLGCGASFYEWNGKQLTLIHFEPWPNRSQ